MSRGTTLDAGQFNRQLTIENELETPDGYGGHQCQYQADGTLWANIRPASSRSFLRADNESVELTHKIVFRFRTGVSFGTRLRTGSRIFEVLTVRDIDETRRYLECECVERK